MARLARRKRTLKIPKTQKGKQELAKKRVFSHRVLFERQLIKAAKHGPEPNALLEMARTRRSMLAQLESADYRLSPYAVATATDVAVSLMNRVAKRVSLLLHFAGKRKANEATMKLAVSDVMGACRVLGNDLNTMPQFIYRPSLPVFVHSKGRATAQRLASQFEAQVVA